MKSLFIGAVMLTAGVQAWSAASIDGSSSGTWVNALPADAVVTGLGTESFSWGTPVSGSVDNVLMFTGTSFSAVTESAFKVGSLYYQNGSVTNGATNVDLRLDLDFSNIGLGHVVGNYTFALNGTPNTDDPIESADYVTFPATGLSSTSFQIGDTAYRVRLEKFDNVVGDGFLPSTDQGFHVEEQRYATADLFAAVTSVPEPSTFALFGMGLMAGLNVFRRRT